MYYIFSFQHNFSCLLQILICCVFLFTQFNVIFKFPWRLPLWYLSYWITFFRFQVFGDLFATNFQFESIVAAEHVLYDYSYFEFVEAQDTDFVLCPPERNAVVGMFYVYQIDSAGKWCGSILPYRC